MNGKTLRALLVLAAVLAGAAFGFACDDTGPSPVGVHFDDAGADTGGGGDDDTTTDAGEDASEEAGDDAGEDEDAGQDSGPSDASMDAEDAG